MIRRAVVTLAAGLCLAAPASAGEWLLGLEAGYGVQTFEPEYEFVSGTPNRRFTNRAEGFMGAFVGGWRTMLAPGFSLTLQGRFEGSTGTWTLQTDEPASLEYAIPVSAGVSLMPAFHFDEATAVFAEIGVAGGLLLHRKQSDVASRYDETDWRPGLVMGGGVERALGSGLKGRVFYRRTAYDDVAFDTHSPAGAVVERVTDGPRSVVWGLGLVYAF